MANPNPPDNRPPESVIVAAFSGLKNTVSPERLGPDELEIARNIDLDDVGQARRRRGYNRVIDAELHSLQNVGSKVFAALDGEFGRIRDDYSFLPICAVGSSPVCCTAVNEETYFSSATASGVIDVDDNLSPWGKTGGQGEWLSPVINPTATLGEVAGKLLGDPPLATDIEAFHGRIYLAQGKTLWRTEPFQYHFVDRTRGFYQFEYDITLVMSVDDGLYVGTTGGLYFLQEERILMREFGSLKLDRVVDGYVVPGSGVGLPVDMVRPDTMQQSIGTGTAVLFLTSAGIMAGFNSGETLNLTRGRVVLPEMVSAAGLFRQDQGVNSYVAAVDSAGGPSANARIGDYVDAQIIRASQIGG
jgi:hypothetical protein